MATTSDYPSCISDSSTQAERDRIEDKSDVEEFLLSVYDECWAEELYARSFNSLTSSDRAEINFLMDEIEKWLA